MRINTNQKGFSALMVLIVVGLVSVVLTQLSQINKDQKINKLTQTNIGSKNEASQTEQRKIPSDIKSQTDKLQKYLTAEAALLGVTDNLSLYFKDGNNSDEIVSLNPSKSWVPASTIKSFVVLEAFRQKRLGLINFNQTVTVKGDNVVPTELESDEFPRLKEGTQVTIRQLVEAMIIQSDNTAYNSLLDILDRRNINNSLKNISITETVVGEKLNLDESQFQKDLTVPGRQHNTITVKDLATYFDLLYSQKIPDSQEILNIFKRQKINNMIPARLPESTIVAHKTGDWAPIYHDGGIVYKPDDPFIFVAFTNSGDPAIVAKLAQVAYYQNAKYVGKNLAIVIPAKKNIAFMQKTVYWQSQEALLHSTAQNKQVLGVNTPNKFPEVTAEDLGITSKDLIPDSRQINDVASAWVIPGSLLYNLKKLFEKGQLSFAVNNSQKEKAYLNLANRRLSEIKTLLSKGDVSKNDELLSEAVEDIKNATNLAKNEPQKEKLIIEIKKTNDLMFAVMAEKANNLPDDKKEQFVDSVYNFYQKGKNEISPVINSAVVVDPTQQKPTIGVIDNISSDKITLKFDDGTKKQVNLSTATNVRSVYQESTEDLSKLKKGNKIAIVGPAGTGDTINAQFILNNIPQGLTDQHKGTVTEINLNTRVIKVIDQKGQVNLVKVDDNTSVKSKDTNVSLEGIKAGSQVVIFGISGLVTSTKSPKPSFTPSSFPQGKKDSGILKLKPDRISAPSNASTPNEGQETNKDQNSPSSPVEIKATSVTVVKNSSGKNETKSLSGNDQKSPSQSSGESNNSSSNQNNSSNDKKDSGKKESKENKENSSKKGSKK